MKSLFVAGNWKSNKTIKEALEWLNIFTTKVNPQALQKVQAVIFSSFTMLSSFQEKLLASKLNLQLGAQDVSPFPEGAYTGEVNAKQLSELATWVIIGHSERRKNFGETEELLSQKVVQAKNAGLKVIYCVQNEQTAIPEAVDVIAYEPPWAISNVSGGVPQGADEAEIVCSQIKAKNPQKIVIYGGSANPENVTDFISQSSIEGVLPGAASLDPIKFADLINNAATLQ